VGRPALPPCRFHSVLIPASAFVPAFFRALLAAFLACAFAAAPASAAPAVAPSLSPCWLKGVDQALSCGRLPQPEDPDAPAGRSISIGFAISPAAARTRHDDPIFVFAGGPGQAATDTAATVQGIFSRLNAGRDIVYVDLRGTGRSNALSCRPRDHGEDLAGNLDPTPAANENAASVDKLGADLRQYATWIAVRDVDAIRAALGYERINLWGASYGSRAALEYLRQYPHHVRSLVLDGAVGPELRLPASGGRDTDNALTAIESRCAHDTACARQYPALPAAIDQLLGTANGAVATLVADPISGRQTTWTLDRATLGAALRTPLYLAETAALVPHAVTAAARNDFGPLAALNASVQQQAGDDFAEALHFAVVCAEDLPRITPAEREAARATRFGTAFIERYDAACAVIPVRPVPAGFYTLPAVEVPALVLSGGADPVTPPRYGDAVSRGLLLARHLIAPNLGHGVSAHGCAPELITRFIGQAGFDGIDDSCLDKIPAPPFFVAAGAERR
jgi:pimeloyl-ACP methyl ester carboxylesterase